MGVIGSESSSASLTMAQLLTTFQKPQLSYLSTTPILSNKNRFPYFSRVVSSDGVQAQVPVNLLIVGTDIKYIKYGLCIKYDVISIWEKSWAIGILR